MFPDSDVLAALEHKAKMGRVADAVTVLCSSLGGKGLGEAIGTLPWTLEQL